MTNLELLELLGPVDAPSLDVTDQVGAALSAAIAGDPTALTKRVATAARPRARRVRPSAVAIVVVAILATGLLYRVVGAPNRLESPETSAWQSGHSLGGDSESQGGRWRLVDDVVSGTWQENDDGPPPGSMDCPVAGVCFALSGTYASDAAASASSDTLYVSTDAGQSWWIEPLPSGFVATSPLNCANATFCATGGILGGQDVLVSTNDGGHRFTVAPLPEGTGSLYALSCPASAECFGLASATTNGDGEALDATFVSTVNGGATMTNHVIAAGTSFETLVCTSSVDCTAVGVTDALANNLSAGVSARTVDGGASWRISELSSGFGAGATPALSCATSTNCALVGAIAVYVANPPLCSEVEEGGTTTTTSEVATTTLPESAVVRAISQREGRLAGTSDRHDAQSVTCFGLGGSRAGGLEYLSDVATSTDGGLTWTPRQLPLDVPEPQLTGISCPTAYECWAAGSDAVPARVGENGENAGSSVLLGSLDGGATWSRVQYDVPPNATNFEGQSFLSVGSVSCATANYCGALGTGAEGSPSEPFYAFNVPPATPQTS